MKMILPFAAILLAGLLTALEGATNGWVSRQSGSLYLAMAAAFGLASLLLLGAALFVPIRPSWPGVAGLPWYAWAGGVYTLVTIALAAWATPKLGAGPALIAALLAQTSLGMALDHFGALGLERSPINAMKIAGLVVMLAGAGVIAAAPKH